MSYFSFFDNVTHSYNPKTSEKHENIGFFILNGSYKIDRFAKNQ